MQGIKTIVKIQVNIETVTETMLMLCNNARIVIAAVIGTVVNTMAAKINS